MARRQSWVQTWSDEQPVWGSFRESLTRAERIFSREPGQGIQADDEGVAEEHVHQDFRAHTDALHDLQQAVEAMNVELARQLIDAGYSLRAAGEMMRTNHATIRTWVAEIQEIETLGRPGKSDLPSENC